MGIQNVLLVPAQINNLQGNMKNKTDFFKIKQWLSTAFLNTHLANSLLIDQESKETDHVYLYI